VRWRGRYPSLVYHPHHEPSPPTAVASEAVFEELSASRRRLEDELGHVVTHLAYPLGAYDDRVRGLMAAAGYRSACSTRRGPSPPMKTTSLCTASPSTATTRCSTSCVGSAQARAAANSQDGACDACLAEILPGQPGPGSRAQCGDSAGPVRRRRALPERGPRGCGWCGVVWLMQILE